VVEKLSDGSVIETDPGGRTVRQVTPDGTVFTNFDGSGRPTRGVLPGGGAFTMTYDAQGDVFQHLSDGSTVETDAHGHVIRQTTADGTVFSSFDGQGRPTQGTMADGTHFTITYDAHGDTFQHFNDGTVVETDPNGRTIQTWLPDGTQITWAVDLPALQTATGQVSAEHTQMHEAIFILKSVFNDVENMWDSPAGMTLHPLVDTFKTVTDSLMTLLEDAINRMRSAYQNYVNTENTNTHNLHH
jgi:YD repeat-containing protein